MRYQITTVSLIVMVITTVFQISLVSAASLAVFPGTEGFGLDTLGGQGHIYYVATNGNDSNPGTEARPFKTVQKGLNVAATPGDTVMVRSGTYREQVEFKANGNASGGFITLRNYPGETPVLTGPGYTVEDWICVWIENKSYVRVQGMTCANIDYTSGSWQKCKTRGGVHVRALDNSHVEIKNNSFYELRGPGSPSQNSYIGAIRVVGVSDNGDGGLTDLVIDGNLVHGVDANNAQAVQVLGNVNGWEMTNNEIYDVDNVLMGTFGYDYSLTEQVQFQPRHGVIQGNYLHDSMSFGGCAAIYLNGGENILVEQNVVHNCFQGISINSETYSTPPYTARDIVVQNNLVYGNYMNGFSLGHMGDIVNVLYRNNTVYQSGREVAIGHVQNVRLFNNVFVSTDSRVTSGDRTAVEFDYNLYYTSQGSIDQSNLGDHSVLADPQLVAPEAGDFHLEASSPAIDAGSSTPGESAPTDFDSHPRPQGAGYDIGAYEYTGLPTNTPTPTNTPLPTSTPGPTMVRVFLPLISKRGVRGD